MAPGDTLSPLRLSRGGGTRAPTSCPHPPAGEPGEDVSFCRMPPLIPNNAADGPAGTSLVRDVARSELVPGRGGTGTRTPPAQGERFTAAQKGSFSYRQERTALKRGGRAKPKGWSIPRCPPTSRLWPWGQRAPFQQWWCHHHHVGHPRPRPGGTGTSYSSSGHSWHSPAKGTGGGRGRGGMGPFLTPGCSWMLAPAPAPLGLSPPGIN